jgi:hypothetical protein|tara:strand:+ start:1141 stop:1431 length:291 start_codon:yes stop_codon:yes gene_type:complete
MQNPNLCLLLRSIAFDNGMSFDASAVQWEDIEIIRGSPVDSLEMLASSLPIGHLEEFCNGESQAVSKLVTLHGLQELSTFLNECFDGQFSGYVYPN